MRALQGLLVAAMVSAMGCMTPNTNERPLEGTAAGPASEGTALLADAPNGNTALRLKVKHLAPAKKVVEDAEVYVVWVQPEDGQPQNVGVLTVNDELEGMLNTVTPFKKFRVTVTPEKSGQVQEPTNEEVFSSDVQR
jgi:hypothetical protein